MTLKRQEVNVGYCNSDSIANLDIGIPIGKVSIYKQLKQFLAIHNGVLWTYFKKQGKKGGVASGINLVFFFYCRYGKIFFLENILIAGERVNA